VIAPQPARRFYRIFIAHLNHLVHQLHIEHGGNKTVADTLNLMQSRLMTKQGGDIPGLDRHNANLRLALAEKLADALQRPPAPHARHKRRNIAVHLPPQFMRRLLVMHARIIRVFKLLRHKHPRLLGLHPPHLLDRPANPGRRGREHQLAPQAANQLLALLAHILRHHNPDLIPLEPPHQRDPDARVAGSWLDNDGIGPQPAIALRPLNHGQGNAILDTPARVQKLRLGKDKLAVQTHQRRAPNQIQNIISQHETSADSWPCPRREQARTHPGV